MQILWKCNTSLFSLYLFVLKRKQKIMLMILHIHIYQSFRLTRKMRLHFFANYHNNTIYNFDGSYISIFKKWWYITISTKIRKMNTLMIFNEICIIWIYTIIRIYICEICFNKNKTQLIFQTQMNEQFLVWSMPWIHYDTVKRANY